MVDDNRVFTASRLTSGNRLFPVRIEVNQNRVTRIKLDFSVPTKRVLQFLKWLRLIYKRVYYGPISELIRREEATPL